MVEKNKQVNLINFAIELKNLQKSKISVLSTITRLKVIRNISRTNVVLKSEIDELFVKYNQNV